MKHKSRSCRCSSSSILLYTIVVIWLASMIVGFFAIQQSNSRINNDGTVETGATIVKTLKSTFQNSIASKENEVEEKHEPLFKDDQKEWQDKFIEMKQKVISGQTIDMKDAAIGKVVVESAITTTKAKFSMPKPAILCIAFNRPHYLNQTLTSLSSLDGIENYPVYISQDGNDPRTEEVAKSFNNFNHWNRDRTPLLGAGQDSAAFLAQHYGFALDRVFTELGHSHVIVIEDDMIFSPDFLYYFQQTAFLLEEDRTIWCISTWNDNGYQQFELDNRRLFRTSFFPGLGWMLRRELWEELREYWPKTHWDHWMRANANGRDCIVPEVSRNFNVGEEGAHMNKNDYKKLLANVVWNSNEVVNFGDLNYLHILNYEKILKDMVKRANVLDVQSIAYSWDKQPGKTFLVTYERANLRSVAQTFGIWTEPRTAHRGLTILRKNGSILMLADKRKCPYLPMGYRKHPSPEFIAVRASGSDINCRVVCSQFGKACLADHFDFINDCLTMKQHFSCAICGLEWGAELPAYVSSTESHHYGECLLAGELIENCEASHHKTQRLCPCG